MKTRYIVIHDTHRGLRYTDGRLTDVLSGGRHRVQPRWWRPFGPQVHVELVDMRERELTIKGQEILTSDKVAVRVTIVTQFRVTDPVAALEQVASYEDRLYSDVQLAARRSLATMTLEAILTNRNQLSTDILEEVHPIAATYGVEILRSDVKDLVFPGDLQAIMNQVLSAERLAETKLIEARTQAEARRLQAESDATVARINAQVEADELRLRANGAQAYLDNPALLRLREIEAMEHLGANGNARIYLGVDAAVDA